MRFPGVLLFAGLVLASACSQAPTGNPKTLCDGEEVNLNSDPHHCGQCDIACPQPPHALVMCAQASCAQQCEEGWADLDPTQPGCESDTGFETGFVFATVAAAGSYSELEQSSAEHRTEAVLAEPTPAPVGGGVETRSAEHVNLTGFNAMLC